MANGMIRKKEKREPGERNERKCKGSHTSWTGAGSEAELKSGRDWGKATRPGVRCPWEVETDWNRAMGMVTGYRQHRQSLPGAKPRKLDASRARLGKILCTRKEGSIAVR